MKKLTAIQNLSYLNHLNFSFSQEGEDIFLEKFFQKKKKDFMLI